MTKYQILRDYGSEGMRLEKDGDGRTVLEFATVDEAVKHALGSGYSAPFLIVTIVDWQATV